MAKPFPRVGYGIACSDEHTNGKPIKFEYDLCPTISYKRKKARLAERKKVNEYFDSIGIRFSELEPKLVAWGNENLIPKLYKHLGKDAEGIKILYYLMKSNIRCAEVHRDDSQLSKEDPR